MRSFRSVWLALPLALGAACTNDFNSFKVVEGEGSGGSGTDAANGGASSGGSSNGGASSGGSSSGGASTDGGIDGSSGGASGGTGGGSGGSPTGGGPSDGGPDSSSGGAGTGGVAGTGGADAGTGGVATGGATSDGAAGTGGSTTDAGSDGAVTCTAQQKVCNNLCTLLTNPATGCGDLSSCSPCTLDHVQLATCSNGACAPGTCVTGFGDCNTQPGDGCERATWNDALNCGACDRVCAGTNVEALNCTTSQCSSTCALGFANCNQPTTGADDGCERDVRTNNTSCGSCNNSCQSQGLVCLGALCGCNADTQCRGAGAGSTPVCDMATGLCKCAGAGGAACAPGEQCRTGGCKCNFGNPCTTAGQTCCQSPAGCFDLTNDAANCGACGRACAAGFICSNSDCQCDANADCNAGFAGTCSAGLCNCGVNICLAGQRCLGNGQCG